MVAERLRAGALGPSIEAQLAPVTPIAAGTLLADLGERGFLAGVQGAWFCELFNANTRTTGASLAYQMSAVVSGFTPLIATALYISPKTAANHVANILSKLDAESRTAAASIALRHKVV